MSDAWIESNFVREVVPNCPPGGAQVVIYRVRPGSELVREKRSSSPLSLKRLLSFLWSSRQRMPRDQGPTNTEH